MGRESDPLWMKHVNLYLSKVALRRALARSEVWRDG